MGGNIEIRGSRSSRSGAGWPSSAWFGASVLGHAPTARATDFRLLLQQRRDRAVLYELRRLTSRGEEVTRATRARQAAPAERIRSDGAPAGGRHRKRQVWEALGRAPTDRFPIAWSSGSPTWQLLRRHRRRAGPRRPPRRRPAARAGAARPPTGRRGAGPHARPARARPPPLLGATTSTRPPYRPALRAHVVARPDRRLPAGRSGRFLYELIPDMRDRILADTGVTGPPSAGSGRSGPAARQLAGGGGAAVHGSHARRRPLRGPARKPPGPRGGVAGEGRRARC